MAFSRRRLLIAAVAIPAVVVVQRAADTASEAIRAGIVALRPRGAGTSATRCAQCGATDHTMLDPGCPLAPRVLS